jgi:hypothetical protein
MEKVLSWGIGCIAVVLLIVAIIGLEAAFLYALNYLAYIGFGVGMLSFEQWFIIAVLWSVIMGYIKRFVKEIKED